MQVTVSEMDAGQTTDDFYQKFFTTMGPAKSFFFEGQDGVLRRLHQSILELEQIVVTTLRPGLFHLTQHTKITGHPRRTNMFNELR